MTYEKDTQDSETAVSMVMVYQNERIQIKTAKGKDSWGEVQEKPEASFQLSYPNGVIHRCA